MFIYTTEGLRVTTKPIFSKSIDELQEGTKERVTIPYSSTLYHGVPAQIYSPNIIEFNQEFADYMVQLSEAQVIEGDLRTTLKWHNSVISCIDFM